MTNEEIGQIFENKFDCYADSDAVVMVMTKNKFIEVVSSMLTAASEEGRREGAAQIEALEKRVKELEERNAKLILAINYLPR